MMCAWQVVTLDLAYCLASDPLTTHKVRDEDDISGFLVLMSTVAPSLEVLRVTAMRRDVVVLADRMPLQHLSLACRQLELRKDTSSSRPTDATCIPASLHLLFEEAWHGTVRLSLYRCSLETSSPE
jgi:hypothetical protein